MKNLFLFSVQILFTVSISYGQISENPSLDSIINNTYSLDKKIDLLLEKSSKTRYALNTLVYIEKAIELAKPSKDPYLLASTYNTLGDYYYFNSNMDLSLQALETAKKNVLKIDKPFINWSITVTMGDVNSKKNRIIRAITLYIESIKILDNVNPITLSENQKIRLKALTMVSANQLANLYLKLEDFDQAIFYYDKAYDIAINKINDAESASVILNNKGETFYKIKRYGEALKIAKKAKQLKINAKMPDRLIATSDLNIGLALAANDSLNSALDSFNSVIKYAEDLNNEKLMALGLGERGVLYYRKNLLSQAKSDCFEAKKIADKINEPEVKLVACKCLYNVNQTLGDYKASLKNYEIYTQIKDSIFNEKNIRKTTQLGLQYEFDKKEAEQKAIVDAKTRKHNLLLVCISILLILALLLAFFFRKRLKYRQTISKQEEILKQQEITKLKQENRLTVINSMIEGQEKERARIAKDLHDGMGSLLSSVKSHFLASQGEKIIGGKVASKTGFLIDQACTEIRKISHNMMPNALVIFGLEGAIKDLVESLQIDNYDITLEINKSPKLNQTQEVIVYRLLQEIISNIKKHAEAKSIFIQLFSNDNTVHLIVEDDGKGFDINKIKNKKGLGIQNIESRVAYLNGTINWDSKNGNGTTINISFNA